MAVPSASDFNKWSGTKFTNTDWDQNVDKTVEILANGNYDLNVAQLTATSYVGIPSDQFSTITAGENLTAGDIVRISSGQAYKADNTSSAGVTAVVGVCNTTVSSGGTAKIDYGFYNGFNSLTAGTKYYVGTAGGLTSTKPEFACEVGTAVSATRINIKIEIVDGEWTTWTPTYSATGSMTWTNHVTNYARYKRTNQNTEIAVEISVRGTLGGTPHYALAFSLPVNANADYTHSGTNVVLPFTGTAFDGYAGAYRGANSYFSNNTIYVFQEDFITWYTSGGYGGFVVYGTYRI